MLYTRNGDCGKSSLIGKNDVPKDDIIFDILGTVDELSAFLGLAKLSCGSDTALKAEEIQKELIEVCAAFAGGKAFDFSEAVKNTEKKTDALSTHNDCLHEFVLYGKSEASARFDISRAVCRRVERLVVKYSACAECPENSVAYFNRLSDYLYIMARCEEKGRNF